jgi:uncharacterized membrane protein
MDNDDKNHKTTEPPQKQTAPGACEAIPPRCAHPARPGRVQRSPDLQRRRAGRHAQHVSRRAHGARARVWREWVFFFWFFLQFSTIFVIIFFLAHLKRCHSEHAHLHLYSSVECLSYLGSRFRVILDLPERSVLVSWFLGFRIIIILIFKKKKKKRYTDAQVGETLIQRLLFVHLSPADRQGKFDSLVLMMQKLYSLVRACVYACVC